MRGPEPLSIPFPNALPRAVSEELIHIVKPDRIWDLTPSNAVRAILCIKNRIPYTAVPPPTYTILLNFDVGLSLFSISHSPVTLSIPQYHQSFRISLHVLFHHTSGGAVIERQSELRD